MNSIRWLTKGILAWILSISLFLLAAFIALTTTIASPHYVKETLEKTDFYDNIIPAALSLVSASNSSSQQQITNATRTELAPILQKVLTPAFLQTTLESVIDGTVVWLKGNATAPTFRIKTESVKVSLTNELSIYLQNRFAALPVCTGEADINTIDPLTATCRPNILLTESEATQYAQDFVNQLPLLDNSEISVAHLDTTDTFNKNYVVTNTPKVYQILQLSPYILGLIIILSSIGIIILSTNHYRAVKTVGNTFLWAGILLVVTGAIALLLSGKFEAGFIGSGTDVQTSFVTTIFTPILSRLGNSFALVSLYIGAAYALVSTLCYILSRKMRRNHLQNNDQII